MNKKSTNLQQLWHTTRYTGFLLLLTSMLTSASVLAQRITLKQNNISLELLLKEIRNQSGYDFLFDRKALQNLQPIQVNMENASLDEVLQAVFKDLPLSYAIDGKTVLIREHKNSETAQQRQSREVRGKIVNANGEFLQGATVAVKGTNRTVTTDRNGDFRMDNVDENAILVISYVGYQPREVKANRNVGIIPMELAQGGIEEVAIMVNTGYQQISQERATGAYRIVSNKDIEKRISSNATSALAGQVPGLTTYKNNIVIRGRSSISVNNDPLIVIDGMPTEYKLDDINFYDVENITVLMDAAAASIYGARAANGVIVIVTKTGEKGKTKIDVQTDWQWKPNPTWASYRQAPTDVYLDWEQRKLEYDARVNNKSVFDYVSDLRTPINSAITAYNSPLYNLNYELGSGNISQEQFDATVAAMGQNNYYQQYSDLMMRTPLRQSYDISASNANERQNTRVSLNYTGNLLPMNVDKNQQVQGYFSTEQRIASWLSFNLNTTAQYYKESSAVAPELSLAGMMGTNGVEPYQQIVDQEGNRVSIPYLSRARLNPDLLNDVNNISAYDSYGINVLDEVGKYGNSSSRLRLRNVLGLKFDVLKGLTFDTKFSYETTRASTESVWAPDSYLMRERRNTFISSPSNGVYVKNIPDGGRLSQNTASSNNYTFRNQLNYNGSVSEGQEITAVAGLELRENENPMGTRTLFYGYDPKTLAVATLDNYRLSTRGAGNGALSYLNNELQYASELAFSNPAYVKHRFVSFYGTAGYSYKRRYSLSGNFRIDQTDLFGTDPKYRYRPLWSIGGLWNVSNEAFMGETRSWLDQLSLKASYGVTGNVDQNSSPFILANGGTNQIYGDPLQYTSITVAPNPTLRWERTTNYNTTLDFSIYKGLVSGQVSAYYKYSDDLLVAKPTPFYTGFTTATVNNGAMSNRGIELFVKSRWLNRGDWRLTTSAMMSYNKNTVERSFNIPTSAANYMTSSYYMVDYPRYAMYAYKYTGLTQGGSDEYNGIPQFELRDGTPIVTVDPASGKVTYIASSQIKPTEAIYMGSVDPIWNGSFTQDIAYKNFELSAMFLLYSGHVMRNPYTFNYVLASGSGIFRNGGAGFSKDISDSWSPDNPEGTLPKTSIYYANGNGNAMAFTGDYWRYADVNVLKANMIRLSNITLGYTLPNPISKKAGMRSVRVLGQVNNPWQWSAAGKEISPETGGYPSRPEYLLRVQIGF